MHKNRAFTIADVKEYAEGKGFSLQFQRYKRVFTLCQLSSPERWGWVYFPNNSEALVALVDDLTLGEWLLAVDQTIEKIIKSC